MLILESNLNEKRNECFENGINNVINLRKIIVNGNSFGNTINLI